MKKTVMIKKSYEFRRLYSKGKIFYGKNLTMYLLKNKLGRNQLGIAVGKKNGKAVDRNKIKRLIRENYKIFEDHLDCGYQILISVNKKCEGKTVTFYDIQKDMQNLFQKSAIWLRES